MVVLTARISRQTYDELQKISKKVPGDLCPDGGALSYTVRALLDYALEALEDTEHYTGPDSGPEPATKTQAQKAGLWVHKRRTPMPAVKPGDYDKARARRAKPAPVMPGTIHIKAKADGGTCMVCSKPILKGQNIIWYKWDKLATHSDCSA